MRLFPVLVGLVLTILSAPARSEKLLQSVSLNACQKNSLFTASYFKVIFTPNNGSAFLDVVITSSLQQKIVFDASIAAYGHVFMRETIDPCKIGLKGMCPMSAGKVKFEHTIVLDEEQLSQVPGITYSVPDLDATVRVLINDTSTGETVACLEADVSNGKTVDSKGVKWATAIIAGLALISSSIVFGLGYMNASAHVATNALSLFGYFQSQAMIGMAGVKLPPVVQSWTQNFQWSMGIIRLDFMQRFCTWYQRATGGTPATILDEMESVSVQVTKRAVETAVSAVTETVKSAVSNIAKRGNIQTDYGAYVVFGIQRAAFRANIETTNLFMTGLSFFCLLIMFTTIGVCAWKVICEVLVKQRLMPSERFLEFRNGYIVILKGILLRLTLIGFPQIVILCLWEFTQKDSTGILVFAVFFLLGLSGSLIWSAGNIIRLARRSIMLHQSPAYILFSDPEVLHKWGFLYIQFNAQAYYFILPYLGYIFIKGAFIGLGQNNPVATAVGFLLIEAAALIGTSVMRPWMDKSINGFNIGIHSVNFINSICLLIFTDVFDAPGLTIGIVGVVTFILNATFSLVLLLMVLGSSTFVYFRNNPDLRYQVMADDRTSFMRSQTQLNHAPMELDALAATARGDRGSTDKFLSPEVREDKPRRLD